MDPGAVIGIKLGHQAVHALHYRVPGGFGLWTVSGSGDCGCELEISLELVFAVDEQIEVCLTRRSNLSI